ncbi:MAG TPA: hypothetical protein VFW40_06475 [Capsulimonadaceae bacterium]|nr:hypothetical protein [Capsulimonadaceae bacterium]
MKVDAKLHAGEAQVKSAHLELQIDLATGLWDGVWPSIGGRAAQIQHVGCAAKLTDGTNLASDEYPSHVCSAKDISIISDEFGQGVRITVHHHRPGSPELEQTFRVYEDLPYFLSGIKVISEKEVATNDITPLFIDENRNKDAGVVIGTREKPRSLFVPYDNDAFVRYSSDYASESYEVTAIYDNQSRRAFVFGSVTHDHWKTGLSISDWAVGRVGSLRVYGGVSDKNTRDIQPHGVLTGKSVNSPLIFVGGFADWRDGLETYGHANARIAPPLPWESGPLFGWNSWYAYMTEVTATRYLAAAQFLKDKLQPHGFADHDTAYINLDSFWDAISENDLIDAVKRIHENGQKAGIYWTPFVFWGNENNLTNKVEGTDGRYAYQEACLKDHAGKPLPKLDGGFPMDPSHPATLARINWQIDRFLKWGFDFVKLDFMTHGALEGAHYHPAITTGTAAYKLGMERIVADLNPAKIGRSFFISLSIAPLFPAGNAHSRRISCDVYPGIGPTEYLLNSLTYGWWAGGALYSYNDPDIMGLYEVHGGQPTTEEEARSRVNSAVVAGSVLLEGDDLTNPDAQQRVTKLLTNEHINTLARQGRSFRPVEGDTGSHAADVFLYDDARNHKLYVAVFNYDSAKGAIKRVEMTRLGLSDKASYHAIDLWTGRSQTYHDVLGIELAPAGSTILSISTV